MRSLIDIEDDLSRLKSQLTLIQMAAGDLIKEQRDAVYLGLEQALDRVCTIEECAAAIRQQSLDEATP